MVANLPLVVFEGGRIQLVAAQSVEIPNRLGAVVLDRWRRDQVDDEWVIRAGRGLVVPQVHAEPRGHQSEIAIGAHVYLATGLLERARVADQDVRNDER